MLVAGSFPVEVESWLQTSGVRCVSFLELEGYLLSNAEITAEGGVYLLLHHLQRTLSGAKVLVIGYGRIGRFIAGKLGDFGGGCHRKRPKKGAAGGAEHPRLPCPENGNL